jgi:subtilisin family serine protease
MRLFALLLPLALALPAAAGEKIITFADGLGPADRALIVESRGGKILKDFPFINGVLASFPDGAKAADLARARGVESAEDDLEINWLASESPQALETAQAALTELLNGARGPARPAEAAAPAPISPVYITTANADGKTERLPWSLVRLGAMKAWPYTKGRGARVAVLDGGVQCSHPDLAPNCAPGYNVLAPGTPPDDEKGHGTHVAGIIAGALNWSGMAGLAPEATIVPVKVLNSSGNGKVSQIIEGMEWAVGQKVDVINMSLGAPGYIEAQAKAVKAARKAGVLVVCAAGNFAGEIGYPAGYEDSVAVTALDFSNKLASFSCSGPAADFTAPGVRIYSSFPVNSFYLADGTSQAAPHISAVAALAVGLGIKGEPALRAALIKASVSVGLPQEQQGAGVPLPARLVEQALSGK